MPLGAIRWELRAKNKLCFIDRLLKKPDLSSLDFGLWEMCNSMIVSWLYNSLDKSLQGGLAYWMMRMRCGTSLRNGFLKETPIESIN